MKKICFVTQAQFGYLIDYYQYSKFLKEDYIVDFICWDYGRTKLEQNLVNVIYISRKGNVFLRNIRFAFTIVSQLYKNHYGHIHINYFRGCSSIAFLNVKRRKLSMDIRTGSVNMSIKKRFIYNFFLSLESLFFKRITVISEGIKRKLLLKNSSVLIPLGGSKKVLKRVKNEGLSLVYVGTFDNRRIDETIMGVKLFLDQNSEVKLKYSIIGTGSKNEVEKIQNAIDYCNLNERVSLLGYVQNDLLGEYFQVCNLGISYVPITDYFQYQPPTKTFEYLLAGLPVLATATFENKNVISDVNGVLINDNPESFSEGLSIIYKKAAFFDPVKIQNTVKEFEWSSIILKLRHIIDN